MRKLFAVVIVMLLAVALMAGDGERAFDKDTRVIEASVGFSSLTTPFGLAYEHALSDKLGLQVSALYLGWDDQTLIMPQAHLNYHFKMKSSKLDLYLGVGAGYASYSADFGTLDSGIFITGVFGVRYYFTESISFQAKETFAVLSDWDGSYALIGVGYHF
ncbi:MAG: porin family protein [bacterium]|nr:porin family protein [bacterium]